MLAIHINVIRLHKLIFRLFFVPRWFRRFFNSAKTPLSTVYVLRFNDSFVQPKKNTFPIRNVDISPWPSYVSDRNEIDFILIEVFSRASASHVTNSLRSVDIRWFNADMLKQQINNNEKR